VSPVSDTGPLIALAKADALTLLKELFGDVDVPPAVHRELLAKSGAEAPRLDVAFAAYLHVTNPPPVPLDVQRVTAHLGAGEQQAIALAYQTGSLLLIDDRSGRSAARRLGVSVTGTVGVLVEAKRAGLVPQLRPVLEQVRQDGYHLSDALIETAARSVGE
jgi:predicted nucleic acid-binding protein